MVKETCIVDQVERIEIKKLSIRSNEIKCVPNMYSERRLISIQNIKYTNVTNIWKTVYILYTVVTLVIGYLRS